ncbi:unnamed protein product, partial [Linum tenue]
MTISLFESRQIGEQIFPPPRNRQTTRSNEGESHGRAEVDLRRLRDRIASKRLAVAGMWKRLEMQLLFICYFSPQASVDYGMAKGLEMQLVFI